MHPEIAATPLFAAASENHPAVVRVLLERGADPNGQIPLGSGPLVAAACSGHLPALEALLAGGADPLDRDAVGMTAAEGLAAARHQVDELRALMGDMVSPADLPMALPDNDALEACARALEEAEAAN